MSRTNGFTAAAKDVKRGMGDVVHDVLALTELQAELFRLDAREAVTRLVAPIVLLAAAGAIALGTIPVLVLLLAKVLVAAASLPQWLAMLIAVLVGFAVAAVVGFAGWHLLRAPFRAFQRSRDEFRRNLEWLKNTMDRQSMKAAEHPDER